MEHSAQWAFNFFVEFEVAFVALALPEPEPVALLVKLLFFIAYDRYSLQLTQIFLEEVALEVPLVVPLTVVPLL